MEGWGAVAALPSSVTAALSGAGADELAGVSMLWLTRDVPAGAELTRDHLPGKRSLQRAAALLALLGQPPRYRALPTSCHPVASCMGTITPWAFNRGPALAVPAARGHPAKMHTT